MEKSFVFIGIYLLIINIVSLAAFGIDKHKARAHRYRISEHGLFLTALLGGSLGAWLGMKLFRHKTQHRKFLFGIPLIFLCQLVLLLWLAFRIFV